MNYKFLLFFFLIFQISCVNQSANKTIKSKVNKHYFLNKGFALVYTDDLYKEKLIDAKIENRSLKIFQKNLKKNSTVKITNLINSKYLIAKVDKKAEYPYFYNSVISQRIVEELEIDELEPYIEIKEIIQFIENILNNESNLKQMNNFTFPFCIKFIIHLPNFI